MLLAVLHSISIKLSSFLYPQDSGESSSSAPATQFIMLPLPAYSVVENPTSIKLVSMWGVDGDDGSVRILFQVVV